MRGAFLMQLGRNEEARVAFDRAIALANTPAEAAHIRMHLDRLMRDSAGCQNLKKIIAAGVGPALPVRPLSRHRISGEPIMSISMLEQTVPIRALLLSRVLGMLSGVGIAFPTIPPSSIVGTMLWAGLSRHFRSFRI